jgi:formate hydrogenlyase subunit 3/multisubunit Na+/H+ antiporter MnhD subunit
MPLTFIVGMPFVVGLLCLFARPRELLEFLNIAGFVAVLVLGVKLFKTVVGNPGSPFSEWGAFLRADALSAWMVVAMSLPLGTLLLFTAWLPGSLRQLMEQAASIIRGMQ